MRRALQTNCEMVRWRRSYLHTTREEPQNIWRGLRYSQSVENSCREAFQTIRRALRFLSGNFQSKWNGLQYPVAERLLNLRRKRFRIFSTRRTPRRKIEIVESTLEKPPKANGIFTTSKEDPTTQALKYSVEKKGIPKTVKVEGLHNSHETFSNTRSIRREPFQLPKNGRSLQRKRENSRQLRRTL